MQTQNSGIHTSLVTVCRGNTMRYDVSRNDKWWPSVHVDCMCRHLTWRVAHALTGGDEYFAIHRPLKKGY